MLATGDVVQATVTDARVFGLICSADGNELLVPIPELSWIASFSSCDQFAESGDVLTVRVNHVDTASRKVQGTIKGLHPNPWKTGLLEIGKVHTARIVRRVAKADRCNDQPGYLVELVPGACAMLCDKGLTYSTGDFVGVVVQESDSLQESVTLALH